MAGRGKPKWANVDCRHCGHGTVIELVRTFDIARRLRCTQCGEFGPGVQWIAPEPRQKPEWLRQWQQRRRGLRA
jgi:hypothetical protein